jgi:outer membrane protein assembly factor BamE
MISTQTRRAALAVLGAPVSPSMSPFMSPYPPTTRSLFCCSVAKPKVGIAASCAKFGLVLACLSQFAGCANSIFSEGVDALTPYRVEIVQGNVVTREQLSQVRVGMGREQVRGVLGAPLLTDMFHEARWDYVFSLRQRGQTVQNRKVTVWFEGDVLKKIDAPSDLPSENDFVATLPVKRASRANDPKLELSAAEREVVPKPVVRDTPSSTPVGALRPFPPLEPAK